MDIKKFLLKMGVFLFKSIANLEILIYNLNRLLSLYIFIKTLA